MKSSPDCLELIKQSEGYREKAYRCPAGIWTIGYGSTRGVKPGDTVSTDEAETMLAEDIAVCELAVSGAVKVPLTQGQFDALVSFAFNCGIGNLRRSTLLRFVNDGQFEKAATEFPKWTRANGRTLAGLQRRRNREALLFKR